MAETKTYEISFKNCIGKTIVESAMNFEQIAAQLASGWLIIGEMILNASIIESVVEVKKEE